MSADSSKLEAAKSRAKQLKSHRVPAWWSDAKLGIFIHWTLASVPGFAPVHSDVAKLMADGSSDAISEAPYTEWYENSLRFPNSSVSKYHRENYGDAPYDAFAEEFIDGLSNWDPAEWARKFAQAGARYVVFVSKHHEGFCFWPTEIDNPHKANWFSKRDLVGELQEAVLAEGMRFGIYYSGGFDWTFNQHPVGSFADMMAAIPREDYPAYADAQVRELIDRYKPSVLWNDICWPAEKKELFKLFSHYYEQVPDGVVNDRWMTWNPVIGMEKYPAVRKATNWFALRGSDDSGGFIPPKPPHFDYRTPEYAQFDEIQDHAWECVRGMDHSFGYNRASEPEDFLSADDLIDTTTDIVAKGGNFLLNVGPKGSDGSIPKEQEALLEALGEWTAADGSSIYGSSPWIRAQDTSAEGHELRYWVKERSLFVALRAASAKTVTIPDLRGTTASTITDRDGNTLEWSATESGLQVTLAEDHDRQVIELVNFIT